MFKHLNIKIVSKKGVQLAAGGHQGYAPLGGYLILYTVIKKIYFWTLYAGANKCDLLCFKVLFIRKDRPS